MLIGCQKYHVKDSPLSVVIKLISAETIGDLAIAEQYIDVDKVYLKKSEEGQSAREAWKEYVNFVKETPNSDKFTNQFKYYNYTIEEWIYSTEAKVTFTSLETSPMIKEIVYSLELVENLWKVVSIEYIN